MSLILRQVVLGIDRVDRALGNAQGAVYALVWIDHQAVRPLIKAVHGADLNTVGVLALNTGFGNYVGHELKLLIYMAPILNKIWHRVSPNGSINKAGVWAAQGAAPTIYGAHNKTPSCPSSCPTLSARRQNDYVWTRSSRTRLRTTRCARHGLTLPQRRAQYLRQTLGCHRLAR